MANKKKIATTAVALGTAAALLLGGTFAWQSINQTALNEASDIVNPGGRLHDDFNGSNKDIYVENFAEEPIYARIRLEEYFEVVMNYGGGAQKTEVLVGSREEADDNSVNTVLGDDGTTTYERVYKTIVLNNDENLGTVNVDENGNVKAAMDGANKSWWNWTTGGQTVYMPTFNLNKDSFEADINGIYEEGNIGAISNRDGTQYTEYTDYSDDEHGVGFVEPGTEIYDGDVNSTDEVGDDFDNLTTYEEAGNIVTVSTIKDENDEDVALTHTAKETGSATLISMSDWLNMLYETEDGEGKYHAEDIADAYWVYDTDGWVYYSKAIPAGEATGLLLTGIELGEVMDDTWYYAINVEAQFVTADDVGKTDGTGFYDTQSGTVPSAEAEALLKAIGVDMSGEAAGDEGDDEGNPESATHKLHLTYYGDNSVVVRAGDSIILTADERYEGDSTISADQSYTSDLSSISFDSDLTEGEDYTYDPSTQTLKILTEGYTDLYVYDASGGFGGSIKINTGSLAMTFSSNPEYTDDGNGGAYIEISKNRINTESWNLWNCSEGAFTLSSSNDSVTIEPYTEGDVSNTDMNIVIPTTVTEDFTVTATAVDDPSKSVVFTVKMVDNSDDTLSISFERDFINVAGSSSISASFGETDVSGDVTWTVVKADDDSVTGSVYYDYEYESYEITAPQVGMYTVTAEYGEQTATTTLAADYGWEYEVNVAGNDGSTATVDFFSDDVSSLNFTVTRFYRDGDRQPTGTETLTVDWTVVTGGGTIAQDGVYTPASLNGEFVSDPIKVSASYTDWRGNNIDLTSEVYYIYDNTYHTVNTSVGGSIGNAMLTLVSFDANDNHNTTTTSCGLIEYTEDYQVAEELITDKTLYVIPSDIHGNTSALYEAWTAGTLEKCSHYSSEEVPEPNEQPGETGTTQYSVAQGGTVNMSDWDGTSDAVITRTYEAGGEEPISMNACVVQFYVNGQWVEGTSRTDYNATGTHEMTLYAGGQLSSATEAKVTYSGMNVYTITLPDDSGVF